MTKYDWDHDDSVVSRKIGVADSGTWDESQLGIWRKKIVLIQNHFVQ